MQQLKAFHVTVLASHHWWYSVVRNILRCTSLPPPPFGNCWWQGGFPLMFNLLASQTAQLRRLGLPQTRHPCPLSRSRRLQRPVSLHLHLSLEFDMHISEAFPTQVINHDAFVYPCDSLPANLTIIRQLLAPPPPFSLLKDSPGHIVSGSINTASLLFAYIYIPHLLYSVHNSPTPCTVSNQPH